MLLNDEVLKGLYDSQFVIIVTNVIVTTANKRVLLEIKRFISRVSLIPSTLDKLVYSPLW